jgi:hypothetical protein
MSYIDILGIILKVIKGLKSKFGLALRISLRYSWICWGLMIGGSVLGITNARPKVLAQSAT